MFATTSLTQSNIQADVLKHGLFATLVEAKDYETLFNLIRSCKFLYDIFVSKFGEIFNLFIITKTDTETEENGTVVTSKLSFLPNGKSHGEDVITETDPSGANATLTKLYENGKLISTTREATIQGWKTIQLFTEESYRSYASNNNGETLYKYTYAQYQGKDEPHGLLAQYNVHNASISYTFFLFNIEVWSEQIPMTEKEIEGLKKHSPFNVVV